MKIKFDPNLDFQKQAIESVCGVFEGQEICQTNFTVSPLQYTKDEFLPGMENKHGIGNRLKLLPEDIHKNIRKIQLKNGLAPSEK
ncbi:MAG: DEAD/DEAH box helicase, partial [Zetaproteobacteria bacterium CG23_combo_of_CG06-09_8_20_14_all_54_7]